MRLVVLHRFNGLHGSFLNVELSRAFFFFSNIFLFALVAN